MPAELASSDLAPPGPRAGKVVVLGGGVAGMRAAIELAEVGISVLLVDASPAIGGLLAKLDHQFPDNHCGMCRILPELPGDPASSACLRRGLFHDDVDVWPETTLLAVTGEPGAFHLDLHRRARRIDNAQCGACPAPCLDACTVWVDHGFDHGLTRRRAIYRPAPLALADTLTIDPNACTRCGDCAAVCPAHAIDLEAEDRTVHVEADAIIVATGASVLDAATDAATARLRALANVVTALELERLLSLHGRRRTRLLRPSDGKPVERIGWLQCVGSRDRKHGRDVCSSVCCMFALKEALLVRAIDGGAIETSIYYMDMRGCGKDSERYLRSARNAGVNLIRSRVHDIAPDAGGGVTMRTMPMGHGAMRTDTFDLLVLSTGQGPSAQATMEARVLGWELSPDGFAPTVPGEKVKSPVAGVFLCGSAAGPADIADSIVGATAAAGEAAKLILQLGRSSASVAPLPRAEDTANVLVCFCDCHHGAAASIPAHESLRAAFGSGAQSVASPCLPEGASRAQELIAKSGSSRVVFVACSPHAKRRALLGAARRGGAHPSFVRVVDARRGAVALRSAVASLRSAEPVPTAGPAVERAVLVVGAGLAGMRAALSLAARGVRVHLVERNAAIGGHFERQRGHAWDDFAPQEAAASLSRQVLANERIQVHLRAQVAASTLGPGYRDTLVTTTGGGGVVVRHGATILATGGHEAATTSYGYGSSERILTQTELEERLALGGDALGDPGLVVMIQCVDAREEGTHDYCSRVCCARALANANGLLDVHPLARVFVLYRDVMTPGVAERQFTASRKRGISFTHYDVASKPEVSLSAGKPVIRVTDPVLGRALELHADWLVLSTGVEPAPANAELARVFGVELGPDGFFREADAKWRPVDSFADGLFFAGAARGPQLARDVVAQAEAAAQRAFSFLERGSAVRTGDVARVHHALCARCGACVEACAYQARRLDPAERRIEVDPRCCRGCGNCTTACPNAATRLGLMGERQVVAALDAALEDIVFPTPGRRGGAT